MRLPNLLAAILQRDSDLLAAHSWVKTLREVHHVAVAQDGVLAAVPAQIGMMSMMQKCLSGASVAGVL